MWFSILKVEWKGSECKFCSVNHPEFWLFIMKSSEPIKSPVWIGSLLKTSISCEISGTYLSGAGQKHHFCGVTVSDLDDNYYCHNKSSLSTCSRTSKIFGCSLVLKVWKGWRDGFYFLFLYSFPDSFSLFWINSSLSQTKCPSSETTLNFV